MLEKDFAIIAVRLLALYIIVMTANALPSYLGMIGSSYCRDPTGRAFLLASIIGTASHIIAGTAGSGLHCCVSDCESNERKEEPERK